MKQSSLFAFAAGMLVCAAAVAAADAASPSPAASRAPSPAATGGTPYRIELDMTLKEKSYKFYVATEPVKATCALEYDIVPAGESQHVVLKSMHYTWVTTGLDLKKVITPGRVTYTKNGKSEDQWEPGEKREKEINPLEVFGKPIGVLTTGGRGPGAVTRNPDKWVRFSRNFQMGSSFLMHRPPLPVGELKAGQTFQVETAIPDPTYSEIEWSLPVQWTVEGVTGTGKDAVLKLSGAAVATRSEVDSRKGKMTDGTLAVTSLVEMKLESAELISGETTVQARWKKDPSGSPTGIMDYNAESMLREKPVGP